MNAVVLNKVSAFYGRVQALRNVSFQAPEGEITIVLGAVPAIEPEVDSEEASAAVAELVSAGVARRQAVEVVARLTGASKNLLYRRSL